jgi:hypothetical protein
MKWINEYTVRLQSQVRAQFSSHDIFYHGTKMTVQGATCKHLKTALRGVVHQNQRQFCKDVEALGFVMNWSDAANAWVVHDSVITGNETKYQSESQKKIKR